ncbi:MAG: hypothetical protein U9R54_04955, partial [Bacteroidota bacterium]|nr:hypothetical protein [Bacteroidota bacterium]
MRVRKILIRIFPLFIISGIAIAVFYSLSSPVNINYSRTDSVLEDQNVYFVDIDNDSVVETITFFLYKNIQQPTIKVFSKQEFRNYWIFTDEKVNDFEIIFSDYDKDGIKEIFAFIQSNDSVFVYGMDIRDKYGFFLERKFVCKVQKYFDKFDFKIYALGSDDSDNDGIDEVYFIIDAKYFKQPRKVFKLNLANNKIEYSNKCGVRLLPSSKMYNIDNNVHKEILMSTFAAANYPDSVDIQYKDNQSWLVVLNSELENVFEPIPFKGAPSTIVSFPYNYKNKLSIGVLYRNTEDSENKLLVYNNKGEQIAKKDLSEIVCNLPIGNLSNDVIAFYNTNNLSIFDKDLKIIRKRNFNRNNLLTIFTKDINFDSKNEFVSIFNDKMIIFNDKLKKICENKIPENVKIIRVSLKKCDKTQLILHTHKSLIYFDITNNYIYKYRWIIYILIVLIIVLLYILYLRRKKNNSFNFRKDKFYDAKVNEIYGSTKFENKVNGKLSVVSEIFKKIESRVGINDRQNALLKHHDSFIKVKKYFDKISLSEYYKKDFVDLIEQFIIECSIDASYIIDFNIFPKKEFIYFNNNVKIEILIIISEIFNQINKSDCDKIFLQVIKNNSYVNLFCEVSCEGKTFIEKNQKD